MQHERATSLEVALAHTKNAISKTWAADGRFAGFADSNAATMASSSLPSSLSIPCALPPARRGNANEHLAERKHVCGSTSALRQELRGLEARRVSHACRLALGVPYRHTGLEIHRDIKVSEASSLVRCNQDVGRFHITVHDSQGMQVDQGTQDVSKGLFVLSR